MYRKQTIRLNESQLRRIVKESVRRVLRENFSDDDFEHLVGPETVKKIDHWYDDDDDYAAIQMNGKWNRINKNDGRLESPERWYNDLEFGERRHGR